MLSQRFSTAQNSRYKSPYFPCFFRSSHHITLSKQSKQLTKLTWAVCSPSNSSRKYNPEDGWVSHDQMSPPLYPCIQKTSKFASMVPYVCLLRLLAKIFQSQLQKSIILPNGSPQSSKIDEDMDYEFLALVWRFIRERRSRAIFEKKLKHMGKLPMVRGRWVGVSTQSSGLFSYHIRNSKLLLQGALTLRNVPPSPSASGNTYMSCLWLKERLQDRMHQVLCALRASFSKYNYLLRNLGI
jgi:hypothetical protein